MVCTRQYQNIFILPFTSIYAIGKFYLFHIWNIFPSLCDLITLSFIFKNSRVTLAIILTKSHPLQSVLSIVRHSFVFVKDSPPICITFISEWEPSWIAVSVLHGAQKFYAIPMHLSFWVRKFWLYSDFCQIANEKVPISLTLLLHLRVRRFYQ